MERLSEQQLADLNTHIWFLGGSDTWRWIYAAYFGSLPYKEHYHIGRINTYNGLCRAETLALIPAMEPDCVGVIKRSSPDCFGLSPKKAEFIWILTS